MFSQRNIHKYARTYPDGQTHSQINHILINSRWHSSILDVQSLSGELTVILMAIWWLKKLGKDWQ